ncbi:MAG: bifunctional nuclease family protein [Cryomorphaceae bacterium]|nr:bifunctional nuclease family protein [Cryomorphaceae bacterium]
MQEIEITVKGLSYSQGKSGAYALILAEKGPDARKLPVVIGGAEAQSIAVALEKSIAPPRPMTHDTWQNMLDELGTQIEKVLIHRLVNGVFYASIYARNEHGAQLIFDSRPSDAVALAVRVDCPIYVLASILEQAGITEKEERIADGVEEEFAEEGTSLETEVDSITLLEKQLEEAVENEDYELAARLRDKLDKLK